MTKIEATNNGARTIRLVGTLHVVFGALGLAWSIARLVYALNEQFELALHQGQFVGLLSVLWIVSGVGVAMHAAWGRWLAIAWALIAGPNFLLVFKVARMRASCDPNGAFCPSVVGFTGLAWAVFFAIVLARSRAFGVPKA
jgi:hypothetical protein